MLSDTPASDAGGNLSLTFRATDSLGRTTTKSLALDVIDGSMVGGWAGYSEVINPRPPSTVGRTGAPIFSGAYKGGRKPF